MSKNKVQMSEKKCAEYQRKSQCEADMEAESVTGSLPDRMINPGEYEPLLPTTEEHNAAELTEDKECDSNDPIRLTPVYTYSSIN